MKVIIRIGLLVSWICEYKYPIWYTGTIWNAYQNLIYTHVQDGRQKSKMENVN